MVFSLVLHACANSTGHQIANVGVAFKINETYLLSMFGQHVKQKGCDRKPYFCFDPPVCALIIIPEEVLC